jgi:hypothetical protein
LHVAAATRTLFLCALAVFAAAARAADAPSYAELQPVFLQRCVLCHSGASAAAGLELDTLEGLRKGATRGPVVVPGQPAHSELIKRLKGQSLPRMPLTGPPWVDDGDIARIERWIAAGLPAGAPVKPAAASVAAPPPPGQAVTWAHVAPIFATRCASPSFSTRRCFRANRVVLRSQVFDF